MPTLDSNSITLAIQLLVAFAVLPVVMAWGLILALRGIRKRLDKIVTLLEVTDSPQTLTRPADNSEQMKIKRALRNLHGSS